MRYRPQGLVEDGALSLVAFWLGDSDVPVREGGTSRSQHSLTHVGQISGRKAESPATSSLSDQNKLHQRPPILGASSPAICNRARQPTATALTNVCHSTGP